MKTITALSLLAALALGTPASAQDAAVSPWSKAAYSSMRLIAGATAPSGKQRVGVEITMSPGFKTYWRSPGDAGVPPVFDWSGSENVGGLDVEPFATHTRGVEVPFQVCLELEDFRGFDPSKQAEIEGIPGLKIARADFDILGDADLDRRATVFVFT